MINIPKEIIKEQITQRLQETFDGNPWYGKSMMSILSLSDKELSNAALSILEHIIAWQDFVISALEGNEMKIEMNSQEDWPTVDLNESEIRAKLQITHFRFLKAIEDFDAQLWLDMPKHAKFNYYQLCNGLIDHNIYHSGQIATEIKNK